MRLRQLPLAILILYTLLTAYTVGGVFMGQRYQPFFTPLLSLLAFTFAMLHAGQSLGWWRAFLLLGLTFAVSLLFESVGVATGGGCGDDRLGPGDGSNDGGRGHWVWDQSGAYFGVPVQNYWGWWLTIFVTLLLFLFLGKLQPGEGLEGEGRFLRLAVLSYNVTGLSSVLVDFQSGLEGSALVGLFAMLP